MNNQFFPCSFMEYETHFSITLTDFQLFDEYFCDKMDYGGYTIEKLAKKLFRDKYGSIKGISFDSEAGMFCAYSNNKELLLELSELLREITGGRELHCKVEYEMKISKQEAENLLLSGFVYDLDINYQNTFLENVPYPPLTIKQKEYITAIKIGTDEMKIIAAKRINSEARTKTRQWDDYLSHPQTISILSNAIERNSNPKVYQELVWALVFICDRHLPDLRLQKIFYEALNNTNATNRWLGLMGLESMSEFSIDAVDKLTNDKSKKVKDKALEILERGSKREFPSWMFTQTIKK